MMLIEQKSYIDERCLINSNISTTWIAFCLLWQNAEADKKNWDVIRDIDLNLNAKVKI